MILNIEEDLVGWSDSKSKFYFSVGGKIKHDGTQERKEK